MSRRVNGQGSKPFQRDGRPGWNSQVWLTDQRTGERKRKLIHAATKTALASKVAQAVREAEEGFVSARGGEQLVETYAELYVDVHLSTRNITPSTLRTYECALRNHVLPVIGKMPLSKVRAADVMRVDRAAQKAGLSNAMRRQTFNQVKLMFDAAVHDRLVRVNPSADVPKPPENHHKGPHYEYDDALRLIAAAKGYRNIEQLVPLLLYSGLRVGEGLALKWDDVHLDATVPYVNVCATIAMSNTPARPYRQDTTKGKRARFVPLVPQAVSALRAAKAARAVDRLAAGSEWTENRLVFSTATGGLLDDRNVRKTYSAIVKRVELVGSFHALRRSCATLLTGEGVALAVVSQILGHSSVRITQKHYTVIELGDMSNALEKLNALESREAQ